ncbi:MAG: DUF2252 domain-containing protein [Oligoflexia bacterium]|nr:DUF2252 domain-containing protein [Oligoflexia bacterium]
MRTVFRVLTFLLLSTGCSHADRIPAAEEASIRDVSYVFDRDRVATAKDPFLFFRSFVDYFYLLAEANLPRLPAVQALWGPTVWCVGDAHAENFGILLLEDGSATFTHNDYDDSGPCPAILDLYRLAVSARLGDRHASLEDLTEGYLLGLRGEAMESPEVIQKMLKKAKKKGKAPDPDRLQGRRFVRDSASSEVSSAEAAQLQAALKDLGRLSLVDLIATSKRSGGSQGLLRYEVLLESQGALLHLEFKEQVRPSITPVARGPLEPPGPRLRQAIRNAQGPGASRFYGLVTVNDKTMFLRPRFDGNSGISLDEQADSDNREILRYEAYRLGMIHSRSFKSEGSIRTWLSAISKLEPGRWEEDVVAMARQFSRKWEQLR